MAEEELDQKYEAILERERLKGGVVEGPEGDERRRHPRIKVNPGDLPVEIDPWIFAIDVSISGMAFYSDEEVKPGDTVDISLADHPTVKARVVDCHLEKGDNPYLPSRYRLHCEFENEEQGKALLVKIKELDNPSPGQLDN